MREPPAQSGLDPDAVDAAGDKTRADASSTAWCRLRVAGLVAATDRPPPDRPRGNPAYQRPDGAADHQVDDRRGRLLGQRGRRAEREHQCDHRHQPHDPGEEQPRSRRGEHEQVHGRRGDQRGHGGRRRVLRGVRVVPRASTSDPRSLRSPSPGLRLLSSACLRLTRRGDEASDLRRALACTGPTERHQHSGLFR